MMAEELISVIRESAGFKSSEPAPATFDVRSGKCCPSADRYGDFPSDSISCPLGYVQMKIGDQTVWAMVDSGSMVNLLPADIAWKVDLTRRKASISLCGIGGHKCVVDGVVEGELVEVAKTRKKVSFLVVRGTKIILGRPFLFAFKAGLWYDSLRKARKSWRLLIRGVNGSRPRFDIRPAGRGRLGIAGRLRRIAGRDTISLPVNGIFKCWPVNPHLCADGRHLRSRKG